MKESIRIHKFGPIRDAEIEDVKKFNFIVGTSGSGKSTVMKLLSLFRWLFKMLNIRAYLQQSGISRSPFRFNIKRCLQDDGIFDYLKKDTEITYINGDLKLEIKGENATFSNPGKIDANELCLEKVVYITEKRNMIADLLASEMKEKDAPFYVNQLFEEFKKAAAVQKTLQLSAVNVRMFAKKINTREQWFIGDYDETQNKSQFSIHLEDASSGIQSLAPLNMLIEYYANNFNLVESLNRAVLKYLADMDNFTSFKPSMDIGGIKHKRIDVHIEEPEMCLYPDNQLHLLNYMVKEFYDNNNNCDMSLFVTTHSPYLLNQLNLLFKAYDLGVKIEGAKLNYEDTNVFVIEGGVLRDIKVSNAHLVNPEYLSAPLDTIYDKYEMLLKLNGNAEQTTD